jgi:hypothetical protein
MGHFLQMSLQLLVKLAGNDLYYNEPYESMPPCRALLTQEPHRTGLSCEKRSTISGDPTLLRHPVVYIYSLFIWYRVAKIHRVRYNLGHFLQMSLQLLVKLAENDLYHNEFHESSPPVVTAPSSTHRIWTRPKHCASVEKSVRLVNSNTNLKGLFGKI